jgi:hypothetical protein
LAGGSLRVDYIEKLRNRIAADISFASYIILPSRIPRKRSIFTWTEPCDPNSWTIGKETFWFSTNYRLGWPKWYLRFAARYIGFPRELVDFERRAIG